MRWKNNIHRIERIRRVYQPGHTAPNEVVTEAIRNVGLRLVQSGRLPIGCVVTLTERKSGDGYDLGFFLPKDRCCVLPEFALHMHELGDDVYDMFSKAN